MPDSSKTALAPLVEEKRRECLRLMARQLNASTVGPRRAAQQALAALDALEKYYKKPSAPPKPVEQPSGSQDENPPGQIDEAAQGGEHPQGQPQPPEGTAEAPKAPNGNVSSGGGQAAIEKSLSGYSRDLRGLCRALWNGGMTKFEFVDGLFTAMRRGLAQAWQDGRDRVGAGRMTDEDMLRVQDIVSEQATYAPGFADFIEENSKASGRKFMDILPRAELWMNRYEEIANEAVLLAAGEQRLKWVWNPLKEHCNSCRDLNGRVYTAKTWTKQNIQPGSKQLECGGWRCGCRFEPTDDPITRGPFPVWIGSPRQETLKELIWG